MNRLEAHLGYWLRYVSNHVSHAFALKVAEHGVTVAEWVVLRELFDSPGMMQTTLADGLGMTRGAISKLADRLAAKRLAVREDDPQDKRTQLLRLTPQGRALVPVLTGLADQNDAEFFGHLEPGERAAVEALLRDVARRRGLRSVPVD